MKYKDRYNKIYDNVNFEEYIIYGENINNGSYIGGLASKLQNYSKRLLNVGNAEYTHIGMGYGIALVGNKALYICKQLDFILFGMDHFISTNEIYKMSKSNGNFIIICAMQDQGYQGPQSSFININDFSDLIDIPIFIFNSEGAYKYFENTVTNPGIAIGVLSQSLFNTEIPVLDLEYKNYSGYEVYQGSLDENLKYRFFTNGFSVHYLKNYLLENNIRLDNILLVNKYANDIDFSDLHAEYNFNYIIDDNSKRNAYPKDLSIIIINYNDKINSVKENIFPKIIYSSLDEIFKN